MSGTDTDRALEAAEKVLHRARTNSDFLEQLETDPGLALQDLFPELKNKPKEEVADAFRKARTALRSASAEADALPIVRGGFLTSIARAAAAAAAGAAVSALLGASRSAPFPE